MKIEIFFSDLENIPAILDKVKAQVQEGETSGANPVWFIKANPDPVINETKDKKFIIEYDLTKDKFYVTSAESKKLLTTFYGEYSLTEYLRRNGYNDTDIEEVLADCYAVPF